MIITAHACCNQLLLSVSHIQLFLVEENGKVGKVTVEIPRSPAGRIGLLSRSPSKVEPMALEDFEDMDADLDKRPTRTSHGKHQQAVIHSYKYKAELILL
jgi:hypothetical protein